MTGEGEEPRPLSRLHVEYDDGTVSAWKRNRYGQTEQTWDHVRVFTCNPAPWEDDPDHDST